MEIDGTWNSADGKNTSKMKALFGDIKGESAWSEKKTNSDLLIGFTNQDPFPMGQSFGDNHLGERGFSEPDGHGMDNPLRYNDYIIVQAVDFSDERFSAFQRALEYYGTYVDPWVALPGDTPTAYEERKIAELTASELGNRYWYPYLLQHEISHTFGAWDYGPEPKKPKTVSLETNWPPSTVSWIRRSRGRTRWDSTTISMEASGPLMSGTRKVKRSSPEMLKEKLMGCTQGERR